MIFYYLLTASISLTLNSYYSFFFVCFLSLLLFLTDVSLLLNSSYFYLNCLLDESSLFIVYITVFVIFISYFFGMFNGLNLSFILILFFSVGFFLSSNLFYLYFFYECSLVPILYIIVTWGSYPDRSLSSLMLLIYTALFSFPFIFVIFYFWSVFESLFFFSFSYSPTISFSSILLFLSFIAFSVKLPIYGVHFWLPIAHVEAPTFGSMVLAGVLLKLGGIGLIRLSSHGVLPTDSLLSLSSYFFIFLVFVTLICCYQSDFKRLVAYSSVSHMMAIPILIFSNFSFSHNAIILLIFFHGLSSPVLFMIVSLLYTIFSSRQLLFTRGLLLLSPFLSFLMLYAFFFTMSAPPLPSYVSEVFFFSSVVSLSSFSIPFLLFFAFFSLVYNLSWLSSILFSGFQAQSSLGSFFVPSSFFFPVFLSLVLSISIVFLCSFV